MSPTRRLHGVAALSAAALATAGMAGQAVAADECADLECLLGESGLQLSPADLDGLLSESISLDFIRSMMAAQGIPPETIEQTLALYEQMGLVAIGETEKNLADGQAAGSMDGLEGLFAAFGGEGLPEGSLDELAEMYVQMGLLAPGQDLNDLFATGLGSMAFPKVEDPGEDAFVKVEDPGEDAFHKVEDPGEDAFVKLEDPGEDAFLKLDGIDGNALTVAEMALTQAAADGDIDQVTLDAILRMLDDE